jgi:hypothetical protein
MITRDGKTLLSDAAPISAMRLTKEGFLVADVRASRMGIYRYSGAECGKPEVSEIRVFRPEAEVFRKETLASFTTIDVTNDHPPEMVGPRNWRKYAVGHTGDEVLKDGEFLRVPILIKDQQTIEEVQSGKRGLSFGYTCDLDFTPGKTEKGEEYDAVQKNLVGNHLAIVGAGRAGPNCRIGDENTGDPEMPGENIKTILVDGLMVRVTDEAERAIAKLTTDHEKAIKAKDELVAQLTADNVRLTADLSARDATIAAKDKDLAGKDVEIKSLRDAAGDVSKLDAQAVERAELLSAAKALGLSADDVRGKANDAIVRTAVEKKMGADKIKDKSADYVRACFDHLVDAAGKDGGTVLRDDPIARLMGDGRPVSSPTNDAAAAAEAHRKMVDEMSSRYQRPDPYQNDPRDPRSRSVN